MAATALAPPVPTSSEALQIPTYDDLENVYAVQGMARHRLPNTHLARLLPAPHRVCQG
jgi:hypothetical protein